MYGLSTEQIKEIAKYFDKYYTKRSGTVVLITVP